MLNKGCGFVALSLTLPNNNLDSHVCYSKTHKKFYNFVTFIMCNPYTILYSPRETHLDNPNHSFLQLGSSALQPLIID